MVEGGAEGGRGWKGVAEGGRKCRVVAEDGNWHLVVPNGVR